MHERQEQVRVSSVAVRAPDAALGDRRGRRSEALARQDELHVVAYVRVQRRRLARRDLVHGDGGEAELRALRAVLGLLAVCVQRRDSGGVLGRAELQAGARRCAAAAAP